MNKIKFYSLMLLAALFLSPTQAYDESGYMSYFFGTRLAHAVFAFTLPAFGVWGFHKVYRCGMNFFKKKPRTEDRAFDNQDVRMFCKEVDVLLRNESARYTCQQIDDLFYRGSAKQLCKEIDELLLKINVA